MEIKVVIPEEKLVAIVKEAMDEVEKTSSAFECRGCDLSLEEAVPAIVVGTGDGDYVKCPRLIERVKDGDWNCLSVKYLEQYCWVGKFDEKPGEKDFINTKSPAKPCPYCN